MAQCKPVLTTDPGPRYRQWKEEALRLLDRAAVAWAEGDPSDPDPGAVLAAVLADGCQGRCCTMVADRRTRTRQFGALTDT